MFKISYMRIPNETCMFQAHPKQLLEIFASLPTPHISTGVGRLENLLFYGIEDGVHTGYLSIPVSFRKFNFLNTMKSLLKTQSTSIHKMVESTHCFRVKSLHNATRAFAIPTTLLRLLDSTLTFHSLLETIV